MAPGSVSHIVASATRHHQPLTHDLTHHELTGDQAFLDGYISELRIWTHARPDDDIAAHYQHRLTGSSPRLRTKWEEAVSLLASGETKAWHGATFVEEASSGKDKEVVSVGKACNNHARRPHDTNTTRSSASPTFTDCGHCHARDLSISCSSHHRLP